ncbi:MAG: TolC family protein [Thermodesulfobacteriota bacterium]|nr:TolC family protein [Thermodesulfobacteriota bacterium]
MRLKISSLFVCFIHLCILILVQNVGADDSKKRVFTLEESISEALVNFSSIKVKKEAIEGAIAVKNQARSAMLPKFSTTYGYTRLGDVHRLLNVDVGEAFPVIPRFETNTEENYQWKVNIEQMIFPLHTLTDYYKITKTRVDASKLDFETERLDLALRVKEAYFNVLKADRSLDVTRRAVTQLESHVNEVRDFFEAGIIPVNDLLKAEVELANTKHSMIKAQNGAKLSRSAFNIILSRQINEPVEVVDILSYEPIELDFKQCVDKAFTNRPEMKMIDVNMKGLEKKISLSKYVNYYPKVIISADYIKAGDSPDVSGSDFHLSESWQATAALSWTFWQWGKSYYSVSEEKSQKRQLIHKRSGLKDTIRFQVKEAILDLEEAKKNIPTTKKAVLQAEENLRVSNERYENQLTTTTEVLDAQTLLTQARLNYYHSLYDYSLAEARLQRAMGEY